MEYFKMFWNGVWHSEPASDPTVQWMVEYLGELFVFAFVLVPTMTVFIGYYLYLDWKEWVKPRRDFERRRAIVKKTGNISVFYMTDDEFEAHLESETDF